MSILTGSNETTALIASPHCVAGSCYFRIRAEMIGGSFTDYSPCVLVNNLLIPYESECQSYYYH